MQGLGELGEEVIEMLGELLGLALQDTVGGVLGEDHAPASLQALAGADALEQGASGRLG